MRNEPTLTEKSKRVSFLRELLPTIENHRWAGKDVKIYKIWRTLPEAEKNRIHQEWQDYYKKAWQTKAAKRYIKMLEIFKRNPKDPLLEQYAQKAREQMKNNDWELQEPPEVDGYELQQNTCVQWHLHVEGKINELDPKIDGDGLSEIWK